LCQEALASVLPDHMTPFINLASEQPAYLETKELDSSLPQERLRFNHNIMIDTKIAGLGSQRLKTKTKKKIAAPLPFHE